MFIESEYMHKQNKLLIELKQNVNSISAISFFPILFLLIELKQNVNRANSEPTNPAISLLIELKQNVNEKKGNSCNQTRCTFNRTKVECKLPNIVFDILYSPSLIELKQNVNVDVDATIYISSLLLIELKQNVNRGGQCLSRGGRAVAF